MVYDWLIDYDTLLDKPPIKEYIASKVNALQLPDQMVNTEFHDDLDAQTSIVEMIYSDLPSYGPYQ